MLAQIILEEATLRIVLVRCFSPSYASLSGPLARVRLNAQSISAIFVTYRCGTGLGKRATTSLLVGIGPGFREVLFSNELVLTGSPRNPLTR